MNESNLKELTNKVKEWSKERQLDKATPNQQFIKLIEEVGELAESLLKGEKDLIIDALGDILVVLIILHQQFGWELKDTLEVAWEEIKNRKGKTIDGVFIKEVANE